MKSAFALVWLLFYLSSNAYSLKEGGSLRITIKGFDICHDNVFLQVESNKFNLSDSLFQKTLVLSENVSIQFSLDEPVFGEINLLLGDSVIKGTGSFIITNSEIQVLFDINLKFPVIAGGENDFYFKNRFLLFAIPNSIMSISEFDCSEVRKTLEYNPENIRLQYYWVEYENNIIEQVALNRDLFFVLYKLNERKDCLSIKTLETCYNVLADTLRNTSLGIEMGVYITNSRKLLVGKNVPVFKVKNRSDIDILSTSILSKNKFTLIEFWASWCAPCRTNLNELKKIYQDIDTSKFQVVTISLDEDKETWIHVSNAEALPWTDYNDPMGWAGGVSRSFNLTYLPQNKLIDPSLVIIDSNISIRELLEYLMRNKLLLTNIK